MADNNQNQGQDPFAHPIRRNNWWLYIIGGLVIAGIIIWFFIDWSYKDRRDAPDQINSIEKPLTPEAKALEEQPTQQLPAVTVEGQE